ncbi:MAG: GlsB/YeaQ/YmgE family stress response membrane protein [Tahibacter sp.]
MHWLWMFIVGLLVGVVAKFLTPGKDPGGFFVTGLIGVAGMFVGGYLTHLLGFNSAINGSIEPSGFIGGVIGSIILLILYRVITKASGGTSSP